LVTGILEEPAKKASPRPIPTGSVTVTPGGPRIKPVYREDIKDHITVGSRVVRGADWSWGNQVDYINVLNCFTTRLINSLVNFTIKVYFFSNVIP